MEDKGERLAQAINYLKKTGQIKNLDDVAEIVDRSKNNISSAINGDKRYLSDKFLKHFNNSFRRQFSLDWLIRGIGSMCCPTASDKEVFETANETANGGDIKDERIKLLEEKIAFLEEQVDFYKNKA